MERQWKYIILRMTLTMERNRAIVKSAVELISGLIEDVAAGHLLTLPTVGILCLDSSNEAHRDLLIRELGRHPLIKTYADELELLVGTSREFQGRRAGYHASDYNSKP